MLATIGVVVPMVTILAPVRPGIWVFLLILVPCFIASYMIACATLPAGCLPVEIIMTGPNKQTYLHFPCERHMAHLANDLAREYYGRDSVKFEQYEQWRAKNSYILSCLCELNGRLLGFFDIIPLHHHFMESFIAGHVTEKELSADDIIPEEMMHHAKDLYFSGIAVRDASSFQAKRHAAMLVLAAVEYIKHFYDLKGNKRLFALAATKEGQIIIENLGFKLASPSVERKDKHNLYEIHLTPKRLEDIKSNISIRLEKDFDLSAYSRVRMSARLK